MTEGTTDIAASLSSLFGPVSDRQRRMRESANNAECCSRCGCPIDAGEPVVRCRCGYGVYLECTRCSPQPSWRAPQPCAHCGRPVFQLLDRVRRKATLCCGRCAWAYYLRRLRIRRRQRRQMAEIACAACSKLFVPRRADARTCSSKCRQWLHRMRHHNG